MAVQSPPPIGAVTPQRLRCREPVPRLDPPGNRLQVTGKGDRRARGELIQRRFLLRFALGRPVPPATFTADDQR